MKVECRSLRVLLRQRVTKPIVDTHFQYVDLLLDSDLGRSKVGIGKCHIVSAKIHIIPLAEDRPIIDYRPPVPTPIVQPKRFADGALKVTALPTDVPVQVPLVGSKAVHTLAWPLKVDVS